MVTNPILIVLCILSFSCNDNNEMDAKPKQASHFIRNHAKAEVLDSTRELISKRLTAKKANNQTRVVHILDPLCDNEYQGIVPVNASLGDGQNLNTNLYWGAGYGVRTFFKKSADWTLISQTEGPKTTILQRLVFKHKTANVMLVADAYAGDKMKECLTDFWLELNGTKNFGRDSGSTLINVDSVDFVIFNGHNGLMDTYVLPEINTDGRRKDAAVIACVSHSYFTPLLEKAGGYPYVMTTNFMAPEAYVSHAIIDAWIKNKPPTDARKEAGKAYNQYQKCGINGATKLFTYGW